MTKPSIPNVLDRFQDYHKQNPAWGSLHIILDDGNVSDKDVEFCMNYAIKNNDTEGHALATILRRMTRTQRKKLGRIKRD